MGNLGPLAIFPHLFRDIPYDAGHDLGLMHLPNDPGTFAARVAAGRDRWGTIIRAQGIKVE